MMVRQKRQQRRLRRTHECRGESSLPIEMPEDACDPCRRDLGDTVVLACSGPSLFKVNLRSAGVPIVAVSTAIRNPQLAKPDVWAFADRLNHNHGDHRTDVWEDPDVIKIVPAYTRNAGGKNVIRVPYTHGKGSDRKHMAHGRDYMDGKLPLMRDTHKSVTFALGWLAFTGVKTIIICGCDLRSGRQHDEKYGYPMLGANARRAGSRLNSSLAQTYHSLKQFAKCAEKYGIRLVSWSPGGRTEEFMEVYRVEHVDQVDGGEGGEAATLRPL